MTPTLFIAILGAVLGTLTFVWNILKWRQENPRITASVEAVESILEDDNFAGIRIKLRNRGGKKTTIERINFYRRPGWFSEGVLGFFFRFKRRLIEHQDVGVANSETAKTPMILDVNGMWEGFIPLEINDSENENEIRQVEYNRKIAKYLRSGELRYSIHCAHSNHRIRGVVKNEELFQKE